MRPRHGHIQFPASGCVRTFANFAATMSAYLFDNPELAAKVAQQEPNYLHQNTPSIITEYNQAKGTGGK